ncbi:MAG: hypothetical protein RLZZ458_1782 [Planctomycetota bacterium]
MQEWLYVSDVDFVKEADVFENGTEPLSGEFEFGLGECEPCEAGNFLDVSEFHEWDLSVCGAVLASERGAGSEPG